MMQAVSSSQVQVLRDRYLQAQLVGDRRGAIQVLVEEGLKKGASITQLQLEVIQEAQREIGQLWQEDRISVAEVHMATAISQGKTEGQSAALRRFRERLTTGR